MPFFFFFFTGEALDFPLRRAVTSALARGDVQTLPSCGGTAAPGPAHALRYTRGVRREGAAAGVSAHSAQEMQSSPCCHSTLSLMKAIGRSFKAELGKGQGNATNLCTVLWLHHLRRFQPAAPGSGVTTSPQHSTRDLKECFSSGGPSPLQTALGRHVRWTSLSPGQPSRTWTHED